MMSEKRRWKARFYSLQYAILYCAAFFLLWGCGGAKSVQAPDPGQSKVAAATPVAVERQTTEGIVIGEENPATNTNSWKAIPYAQPPVGTLRWKAPSPPKNGCNL